MQKTLGTISFERSICFIKLTVFKKCAAVLDLCQLKLPHFMNLFSKGTNSNNHSCIYSLFTAGFCNSSTQLGLSSQPSMRRSILAFAHLHLKHCRGLGTQDPLTWHLSSQFLWCYFLPPFFDAFSKTILSTVGPPMK